MVLDREPPPVTGIVVRKVATFDEFEQMEVIRSVVFGGEDQERDGHLSELRRRWTEFAATNGAVAFLAERDGTAVAYWRHVSDRTRADAAGRRGDAARCSRSRSIPSARPRSLESGPSGGSACVSHPGAGRLAADP